MFLQTYCVLHLPRCNGQFRLGTLKRFVLESIERMPCRDIGTLGNVGGLRSAQDARFMFSSSGAGGHWKSGAGDRDRTGDIQLGKLAFYR